MAVWASVKIVTRSGGDWKNFIRCLPERRYLKGCLIEGVVEL
jgi:hypothetical protein